jgi:phage gp36-like protein
MTFATTADLEARFGTVELLQLTDREGVGLVSEGVAEAHLQDADAEIISLIGGAVVIDPLNPPLNLKRLACDIARYKLHGATAPEDVRKRYDDAVKFLVRVAEGKATLDGGAAAPSQAQQPPLSAATEPGNRIFSRGL